MRSDKVCFLSANAKNPRLWGLLAFCCLTFVASGRLCAGSAEAIRAYFISGDYQACIREGERMLASARSGKGLDELYCMLGLSYLKTANYLRASDIFEIVLNEYKDSPYSDDARVGLGDSYFLRSDFAKARSLYEALLKDHGRTKLKAGIYYRLSLLGRRTHDRALEQKYLDKLHAEFPSSPEVLSKTELFPASVPYSPRTAEAVKPAAAPVIAEADRPVLSEEVQSLTVAAGAYSVQVGAFSSRANAQNLAGKLTIKGYPAFIVQSSVGAKPLFKVRVGHFPGLAEAKNAERQLRLAGYPTKIIP